MTPMDGFHRRKEPKVIASAYERRRQRMIAERAAGKRVLDIGCAQLPNAHLVARGFEVTGLDINPMDETTGYVDHIVCDVFDAPSEAPQAGFDTIVLGEFIEHVERQFDLLRLLSSLMRSEGRLIVSTPNPVGWPMVVFEWFVSERRFYSREHTLCLSPRWMLRMLETAGYRLDEMVGVGIWPSSIPSPAALSYQVIYVARPKP